MKSGMLILIVVVVALGFGGCQFVSTRNGLAVKREAVKAE